MKKSHQKKDMLCDIVEKFVFVVWTLQYILNSTSIHYQKFTSLRGRSRSLRPLLLWKNISCLVLLCSELSICYNFAPPSQNKRVDMQVGWILKTRWLTVLWEVCVCVCVSQMNEIWHLFRHTVFSQAFIPCSVEVLQLNSFRHCTGTGVHHVSKVFKALFKIIILKCYCHDLLCFIVKIGKEKNEAVNFYHLYFSS